jgi:tRNA A-37 threonylcarbamoyl transferase component Bud32
MRYPNEATYCFVDGSDLIHLKDARIGSTIAGRYVVEEAIGEGGMATVYRATQKLTERACAIKVMNSAFARELVVRERFRREAKSAQKLAHPNIIEIFDQGETEDGTAYIVMELLVGSSLADVIAKGGMPIKRAVGLMIQIARGIARAHDLDVIHRDLKPENIFLCKRTDGSDIVKLLDFGIALSKQDSRLTGAGEIFGTPQYMAPERIQAGEPGPGADLYSIGVVFYELVTGTLPFDAPDIATFFNKHLKEAPRPPRSHNPLIPLQLDALILRLLAKDPKGRPVDAHRVHQDLLDIAKDVDAEIPPVPESEAEEERTIRTLRTSAPKLAVDRWGRRVQIFQQMMTRAFGDHPPKEPARVLAEIRDLAPRVMSLRATSVEGQQILATLEEKGREARQRFGFAVDALGVDASRAKDEVRVVEAHVVTVKERTAQAAARFKATHKEIVIWEGRSAFQEPYVDLAKAYRNAALAVDVWLKAKEEEKKAVGIRETNERTVSDLEFQIQALRGALGTHEKEVETERAQCEKKIIDLGKQIDQLESQILSLATKFCEPLRSRPELLGLFQELEADTAVATSSARGPAVASLT